MARILVVDDEPSIRMLIRTILQSEGHSITTASNGREALEMVIENVPDLIVLDLMMPEMDGWHLLEELHIRGLVAGRPGPRAPLPAEAIRPFESHRPRQRCARARAGRAVPRQGSNREPE